MENLNETIFCPMDCAWLCKGGYMPPKCARDESPQFLREHSLNVPMKSLTCIEGELYETKE